MSAAVSYAEPRPQRRAQSAPRQIDIVTTRAQRKARPKAFYAVVAVGSIFALFLAQLMLSIVLSDGAYQITSLQAEQKQLSRTERALSEQLDLLASPQSLATKAEGLGMVIGTNAPVFLRLSDGALAGTPTPASGTAGAIGADGGLVPNALLIVEDPAAATLGANSTVSSTTATGAPSAAAAGPSVPSNGGPLPSPQTH